MPAQLVRPVEIADRDTTVGETHPVAACPVKQRDPPERGHGVGSDNRDLHQEAGDKPATTEWKEYLVKKPVPAADSDCRWPGWP